MTRKAKAGLDHFAHIDDGTAAGKALGKSAADLRRQIRPLEVRHQGAEPQIAKLRFQMFVFVEPACGVGARVWFGRGGRHDMAPAIWPYCPAERSRSVHRAE